MEERNESALDDQDSRPGKIGVVLTVLNAFTALGLLTGFLLFWICVVIPPIFIDAEDFVFRIQSLDLYGNLIRAFGIPAAMCIPAPVVLLLAATIAAIRKSGRGWRWAVWGHGLILVTGVITLYYALNLFEINDKYRSVFIEIVCGILWTAALLIGNILISRNRSKDKTGRFFRPVFITLLCLQIFLLVGGHRIGTMLLLDSPSMQQDCLFDVVSDEVIEVREEWGDIETRDIQFRPYDNEVLSYSFRMPASAKREQERDKTWARFRINGKDGDLSVMVIADANLNPNSVSYDPNRGAILGSLNEMDGIDIFGEVTDPFERLKIIRNATPDKFSLLSSYNDNFRLFVLLELKRLMICVGDYPEEDGYHTYRTTCLKSIRGLLSKQVCSDWVDSKGRSVMIFASPPEDASGSPRELTPDEIKLINNIIASIRIVQEPQQNITTD